MVTDTWLFYTKKDPIITPVQSLRVKGALRYQGLKIQLDSEYNQEDQDTRLFSMGNTTHESEYNSYSSHEDCLCDTCDSMSSADSTKAQLGETKIKNILPRG